jgi:anthranilate synthase/aminodeoxychorismate synthase-like glutamine amidotransferase
MVQKIKLLMIDNYDSFTYNIVQYLGELGAEVEVFRNDEITLDEIEAKLKAGQLDRLVISPGPCSPAEAGISVAAIQHFAGKLPILGVCLGHQAVGAACIASRIAGVGWVTVSLRRSTRMKAGLSMKLASRAYIACLSSYLI